MIKRISNKISRLVRHESIVKLTPEQQAINAEATRLIADLALIEASPDGDLLVALLSRSASGDVLTATKETLSLGWPVQSGWLRVIAHIPTQVAQEKAELDARAARRQVWAAA